MLVSVLTSPWQTTLGGSLTSGPQIPYLCNGSWSCGRGSSGGRDGEVEAMMALLLRCSSPSSWPPPLVEHMLCARL